MDVLSSFVKTQLRWSRKVDGLLPAFCSTDGHQRFHEAVVPARLRPNLTIYDVGGGKQPFLTAEAKRGLNARVAGLDIDAQELALAPAGSYDKTIATDIALFNGRGDAGLVICQAVLEHVQNPDGAMRAIASILAGGGEALIFVPCRNALFARINLLLPERVKRAILFRIFPATEQGHGFRAYYRACTPSALSKLARDHGLEVVEVQTYWTSVYFYAFFPAYLVWRAWLIVARALGLRDCCETFTLTLRKPI